MRQNAGVSSDAANDRECASRRGFLRTFAGSAALASATPLAAWPRSAISTSTIVWGWRFASLPAGASRACALSRTSATGTSRRAGRRSRGDAQAGSVAVGVVRAGAAHAGEFGHRLHGRKPARAERDVGLGGARVDPRCRRLRQGLHAVGGAAMRAAGRPRVARVPVHLPLRGPAGQPRTVLHRTLVLSRPPLLCTFNMLDLPADRVDAQREFDALCASIALA